VTDPPENPESVYRKIVPPSNSGLVQTFSNRSFPELTNASSKTITSLPPEKFDVSKKDISGIVMVISPSAPDPEVDIRTAAFNGDT
jgi:hypothetical protein